MGRDVQRQEEPGFEDLAQALLKVPSPERQMCKWLPESDKIVGVGVGLGVGQTCLRRIFIVYT